MLTQMQLDNVNLIFSAEQQHQQSLVLMNHKSKNVNSDSAISTTHCTLYTHSHTKFACFTIKNRHRFVCEVSIAIAWVGFDFVHVLFYRFHADFIYLPLGFFSLRSLHGLHHHKTECENNKWMLAKLKNTKIMTVICEQNMGWNTEEKFHSAKQDSREHHVRIFLFFETNHFISYVFRGSFTYT